MRNYTGKKAQFGCNDIIMLITDGAPNYFKQIFHLYNKNKSVNDFIISCWILQYSDIVSQLNTSYLEYVMTSCKLHRINLI